MHCSPNNHSCAAPRLVPHGCEKTDASQARFSVCPCACHSSFFSCTLQRTFQGTHNGAVWAVRRAFIRTAQYGRYGGTFAFRCPFLGLDGLTVTGPRHAGRRGATLVRAPCPWVCRGGQVCVCVPGCARWGAVRAHARRVEHLSWNGVAPSQCLTRVRTHSGQWR